ncbi:ATP-binding cassette domain-containing protein [Guptibacillus algicola]|uniref:ATP-binding cassette domain-containing protein n=1 Tax=Guptibacillus algicola TaxID=225844 RepID=UPI001CD448DC|nr:ATP-binding cassette domain-containing protein [Alkalihalobacillus algicola]MCA0986709.1 ATP-binding cassette domain-containing protein [Alkalihalobacillus algicola]
MIEITKLSKQIKSKAILEDLTVSIEGGVVGLIGPNGAGKSTLLKILSTVTSPSSGDVKINGYSVQKETTKVRKQVGYLPQHFQLYPQLTGSTFLDYAGNLKRFTNVDHKKEKARILKELNLSDYQHSKVKTYSNGMRQRLGIAQAMYGSPDVIVFDEPSSGLDPDERLRFRQLIANSPSDKTIILSTHIVEDIEASCDTLIVLKEGKIIFHGSPDELQRKGDGFVWELELFDENATALRGLQITFSKQTKNGYLFRVLSPVAPLEDAEGVNPTLEEGYMTMIGWDMR